MKVKLGIESPMTQLRAEGSSSSVTVFLVAENRLLRETLLRLFQSRAGISVVGECHYSDSASEHIIASHCDVLLLDSSPMSPGTSLVDEICQSAPEIKVVLFGMDENPYVFLRAVRSGVCGYVLKEASSTEIIAAVREVAQGDAVCSPKLCMTLFRFVAHEFRQRSGMADQEACLKYGLTYRQRQLVALIAKGLTNKEIAANLNLSEFTVKNHIHRIMRQVDADSRHQAVDLIRAGGLLADA